MMLHTSLTVLQPSFARFDPKSGMLTPLHMTSTYCSWGKVKSQLLEEYFEHSGLIFCKQRINWQNN